MEKSTKSTQIDWKIWGLKMAAKKEAAKKATKKVEEKKAEPKVEMVKVMRFNKAFGKRELMEVPTNEVEIAGYYADIIVEE